MTERTKKLYSPNEVALAIAPIISEIQGIKESKFIRKHAGHPAGSGNDRILTWEEINAGLTARGWAPRIILRIRQNLRKVSKLESPDNDPAAKFIEEIDRIEQLVDSLRLQHMDHLGYSSDEINWGHVGTAATLRQKLEEALALVE